MNPRTRSPRAGRLLAAAALVPATLSASGCAATSVQRNAASAQGVEQVGLTQFAVAKRPGAPHLSASTLTGAPFSLSSTLGNVVVLNVWASWCGPCRSESPALARAAASFSGRAVKFIGIDEQDDNRQAKKFLATAGTHYPNLVDNHGQLLSQLRLLPQAGVPSTLVLDGHGRIADRFIGPVTGAEITSVVVALLRES
jgi:thiol-disulfide isomerase/thioredoxin